MNIRSHLELWAGFPLLFEIRKCFETVQQQVDTAARSLLFLCRADYESAGRRCWGPRELVRIWRVLLWRLFSLGYSLMREFNGVVRHYHSMKHNNSGQQLTQPCVNSDIQCLWMFIWSLLRDNSFTHTLYLIYETYNLFYILIIHTVVVPWLWYRWHWYMP